MRAAILFFVKYPEPGTVKTRLAAVLGAERAADIYRQLVRAVILQLPSATNLIVCFDPPERAPEIAAWLQFPAGERVVSFVPQARGNLGARLEHAFAHAFAQGYERVLVVGSDCVEINPPLFTEAWQSLESHDVVVGPSHDGGYYLLGLKQPSPALFRGVSWSTDAVLAQTRARAATAGWRLHELVRLHDVDEPEDWVRAEGMLRE